MTDIKLVANKEDYALIIKIANRMAGFVNANPSKVMMDVTACHLNGCPLRLNDLLQASSMSFMHDMIGIEKNLNRSTGQIENQFLPRFHA